MFPHGVTIVLLQSTNNRKSCRHSCNTCVGCTCRFAAERPDSLGRCSALQYTNRKSYRHSCVGCRCRFAAERPDSLGRCSAVVDWCRCGIVDVDRSRKAPCSHPTRTTRTTHRALNTQHPVQSPHSDHPPCTEHTTPRAVTPLGPLGPPTVH